MSRPSKQELLMHSVYYPSDTPFSAHARLLQSKWRMNKGYAYKNYGNFLEIDFAKTSKANFLTERIGQLVNSEIAKAKKSKGLIGEPRIWNNLLSSQPLCFNLFGELYYDLDLASLCFKRLFPERVDVITGIKFEYSPGRGNLKYIGDHSAFDVFLEYSKNGRNGFIGIEVKYAECLREETKEKAAKNYKEQYSFLTEQCGLFKADCVDTLKEPPLSQIWRDHLLSIATKQDYDEGFFVFLFPRKNNHCQNGVDLYKTFLRSESEYNNGFYPRYLEDFILELVQLSKSSWATELKNRYIGSDEF